MRQPVLLSVCVIVGAVATSLFTTAVPRAQAPSLTTGDLRHPQGTNGGIFAFTSKCASCHDSGRDGAPDRYTLNRRTPEQVLATITTGPHAAHADGLTEWQKRVMAVYLGGRPLGAFQAGDAATMPNRCTAAPAFTPFTGSEWNGWGADGTNTRFQPAPGLSAAETPALTLKWAFGFPQGNSAYGQPAVVGGRVFVGADTGFVYALDAKSGCVHWSFRADAGVRTAPTVGRGTPAHRALLYFGDIKANVYAVNAETGALVWRDRLDTHPMPASPAHRPSPAAASTCRFRRSRNPAPGILAIRAVRSAAGWRHTTRSRAGRSGSRTPWRTPR